jgi:ribosome maturation factor RimP
MDEQVISEDLKKVINPILEEADAELVELDLVRTSGQVIVRLFVDKIEGGISLDECALINKRLGDILDEQNIIADRYILEVSSPGLDRPLKTKNDFRRCTNKKVKFFLREPIKGKVEWDGAIINVTDDEVSAQIAGDVVQIPLAKINKAKQLLED